MKFFRAAPVLVALAFLLGTVPAFATEAPDSPDAYAPEAGEVLTDGGSDSSVSDSGGSDLPAPDGDGPVLDDTPSDTDGNDTPVDDTPSDTDGDDVPVEDAPSDADGDDAPAEDTPSEPVNDGSNLDGFLSNSDNRTHTTVTDIGGGKSEYPSGDLSGSLPEFLRAMFGEYTPKTQTVTTYLDGQVLDVSTEYVPGIAGMDMEWIASVILFGLVVFCLFRLLGGMVR